MAIDVTQETEQAPLARPSAAVRDVTRTTCCIVGGGPAGAVLALLFARAGIPVTLLEKHGDFDRDFRGDTIHVATMEMLDQLGLAERLRQLPHTELSTMTLQTDAGDAQLVDFRRLRTRFPFITFMPQVEFLDFVVAEAARYPNFRLVLHADVRELVTEGGRVRGVRYQAPDGRHEVRARLTVGADGRFSQVRRLAGQEARGTAPPIDVLWFRIPRRPDDGRSALGVIRAGSLAVLLDRGREWQIAFLIPKGGYKALQAAGLPALRQRIAATLPALADRVDTLATWRQFSLLSVESSRVPRWYKPGLLLIGDAAHVMSPVAGVGINYAIQDAVAAANLLTEPLRRGPLRLRDLAAVQRRREWPTRVVQTIQGLLQDRILQTVAQGTAATLPVAVLRVPLLHAILARFIAYGVGRARLKM